jgi:hypothetical protein
MPFRLTLGLSDKVLGQTKCRRNNILNGSFEEATSMQRISAFDWELPHTLPDTGHSASCLIHVSRPIRDFAGSLRSKRSSFRDTINHLYQVQAHSYVDDSRYLCNHQQLANLGGTVAIFDVLQKPMCRHRLDAAIVPRPFILPFASSLTFSPFRSFAFRSAARSPRSPQRIAFSLGGRVDQLTRLPSHVSGAT